MHFVSDFCKIATTYYSMTKLKLYDPGENRPLLLDGVGRFSLVFFLTGSSYSCLFSVKQNETRKTFQLRPE